jgi:DNA-binding transcriptional LysR family regulator
MRPAINEFLQQHPKIEFELDFNDREVDLMQEGFDLAIRIAKLPDSSLIAHHLATIYSMICASPTYLDNMGAPMSLDDLSKHRCLAYSLSHDFNYRHFTDANGKAIRLKIRTYLKATTGEFLRGAAIEGIGIALLPSFIAYQEIERGDLIPLLTDYKPSPIDAYAIYPQTRQLSKRVRGFVDFLVERFEGMPYWDKCIQK